jgi:hypothetical protein
MAPANRVMSNCSPKQSPATFQSVFSLAARKGAMPLSAKKSFPILGKLSLPGRIQAKGNTLSTEIVLNHVNQRAKPGVCIASWSK